MKTDERKTDCCDRNGEPIECSDHTTPHIHVSPEEYRRIEQALLQGPPHREVPAQTEEEKTRRDG